MSENLAALSNTGVSIWLDDLSRTRIKSGNLQELIDTKHVVGVTTNPAIFSAAIGDGSTYADQVADLAKAGAKVDEAVFAMIVDDVRAACDIMMPVYEKSNGEDGRVSIEVDPRFSADYQKTIDQARDLWKRVDRPNTMIKIPATPESLPAVTDAIAEGISVNVTLIFSVAQYEDVMDAYMKGVEKGLEKGTDMSKVRSVASFFVSRVDTMIDPMLDAKGTDAAKEIRSTLGVANARLAYEAYEKAIAGQRWQKLAEAGANRQRPLWASTGVKDPSLSPTLYVDELAVDDTVNTMPEATLLATEKDAKLHGDAVHGTYEASHELFAKLEGEGISFDECADKLLSEGVDKFEVAWNALLDNVDAAMKQA